MSRSAGQPDRALRQQPAHPFEPGLGVLSQIAQLLPLLEQLHLDPIHLRRESVHLVVIPALEASGLVARGSNGECTLGAELLRSMNGLHGLLGPPSVTTPDYDGEIMGEASRLVFIAENQLRKLVFENLAETDPAWWIEQTSPELRGDAEGRRDGEAEVLPSSDTQLHPVMYLNLGELLDIVYRNENWDRVFRAVFPLGKRGVEEEARRFNALRNRVAHSRPLSRQALRDLEDSIRRLGLLEPDA